MNEQPEDFSWVFEDYKTHPARFILEVLVWVISVASSIVVATTAPNIPMIELYPFWIIANLIYGWAAMSRSSFGMLINSGILVVIDLVGLFRLLEFPQ